MIELGKIAVNFYLLLWPEWKCVLQLRNFKCKTEICKEKKNHTKKAKVQ